MGPRPIDGGWMAGGGMRADLDPEEAGTARLEAWHGAVLHMKIDCSPAALERFKSPTLPALPAPFPT